LQKALIKKAGFESQISELKEFAAKEPEKISARTSFWPEAGFFIFNLINFIKFGNIFMKGLISTHTNTSILRKL